MPACSLTNFRANLLRGSAAAGTGFLHIGLVNRGPVCSLERIEARGFNPSTNSFVGPWAKFLPERGVDQTLARVGVVAQGAVAQVALGVETATNYSNDGCRMSLADSVRLAEIGHLKDSIALKLYAPTQVCTIKQSLFTEWPSIVAS